MASQIQLKQMVMDQQLMEAMPSNFKCPISLEPMQDPVTLCTGQTYERSSIQRWLDAGHITCPSTMQILSDFSLTPNNTLRDLIHSWYRSNGALLLCREKLCNEQLVTHLIDQIRLTSQSQRQWKASCKAMNVLRDLLIQEGEPQRSFSEQVGAVDVLLSFVAPHVPRAAAEAAIAVIVSLQRVDDSVNMKLSTPAKLTVLVDLLHEGSRTETRIHAAKMIKNLVDLEDFTSRIGSWLDLIIGGTLRLIQDQNKDFATTEAGLSCMLSLCSCADNRLPVVKAGTVVHLIEFLPTANTECAEIAMAILDLLCNTADGRSALHSYANSISVLVNSMRKISENLTHHALSLLCIMCRPSGTEVMVEEAMIVKAVKAGAVANLLLIMQSSCSPALKQRCVQLLKLLCHKNLANKYLDISNEVSKTLRT